MNDADLFEEALLKVIDNKKDKALALVETALSAWPEDVLKDENIWSHTDMANYFIGWLRKARSEFYAQDFGKKR